MDEKELFKYYLKTRVIFQTALLYLPAIYFTLYFDAFITSLILCDKCLSSLVNLFSYPWWKIMLTILIQYCVCCFFWGLFAGLRKVIIKNQDFFLG